jgi:hypothetical protein
VEENLTKKETKQIVCKENPDSSQTKIANPKVRTGNITPA